MGAFFNILSNSIGSLIIGLLLTAAAMALMFFIIKSWYKHNTFTPLSYIVGAVLFLILSFHASIICGAITIKGYGDDAERLINGYVSALDADALLSADDSQAIIERLGEDLPLVEYYADYADFHGHTPSTIAAAMNDELQSFMNEYILKHVLWLLFFAVVGAFCIIRTTERGLASRGRSKVYTRSEEQF